MKNTKQTLLGILLVGSLATNVTSHTLSASQVLSKTLYGLTGAVLVVSSGKNFAVEAIAAPLLAFVATKSPELSGQTRVQLLGILAFDMLIQAIVFAKGIEWVKYALKTEEPTSQEAAKADQAVLNQTPALQSV